MGKGYAPHSLISITSWGSSDTSPWLQGEYLYGFNYPIYVIKLKNSLVVGFGHLSSIINGIRRLEDVGASAVVLCSLFEGQVVATKGAVTRFASSSQIFLSGDGS